MKIIVAFCLLLLSCTAIAQKPFVGKLVYSVEIADTALTKLFPSSKMVIFTNDTLLRVETQTATLGDQILIQHLAKQKAYLLVASAKGNFAIQIPDVTPKASKYTFKKGRGKKTIAGLKSAKLLVTHPDVTNEMEFFYNKKISAKYLPGFETYPGLLTEYYTVTQDGVYRHTLVEINYTQPSKDLFGVPSDYQRISMDDFVDKMTGEKAKGGE